MAKLDDRAALVSDVAGDRWHTIMLSSVALPLEEIGRQGAEMLLAMDFVDDYKTRLSANI